MQQATVENIPMQVLSGSEPKNMAKNQFSVFQTKILNNISNNL